MNFAELTRAVEVRVGAPTEDELLTTGALRDFVRSGLRAVEADVDNPDWLRKIGTITVLAGFDAYVVPADWAKTMSLRAVDDNCHLTYVGWESLDADFGALAGAEGAPAAWTQQGGTIYLRPTPAYDTELEHRYVRAETTLDSDDDVPLLPPRFHDAIVEKACALACRRSGEYARAREHEIEYQAWIKKMWDEQTRVVKAPRIRRRPW